MLYKFLHLRKHNLWSVNWWKTKSPNRYVSMKITELLSTSRKQTEIYEPNSSYINTYSQLQKPRRVKKLHTKASYGISYLSRMFHLLFWGPLSVIHYAILTVARQLDCLCSRGWYPPWFNAILIVFLPFLMPPL